VIRTRALILAVLVAFGVLLGFLMPATSGPAPHRPAPAEVAPPATDVPMCSPEVGVDANCWDEDAP
jgi:hypothetical protein